MTRTRFIYGFIALGLAIISLAGCGPQNPGPKSEEHTKTVLTSFSQEITSPVHQFQVKAGASYTLDITVKNTGTEPWVGGSGAMSVAAGYRWHDSKGNVLPMEGNRALLTKSQVGPGETDSLKLQVTAPSTPGSYTLSVSMVQEGVSWFFDKGAKPLDLQVTVLN